MENNNLDNMLNNLKEEDLNQIPNNKKNSKKRIYFSFGIILIFILIGIVFLIPKDQFIDKNFKVVDNVKIENKVEETKINLTLPDWQKKVYYLMDEKDIANMLNDTKSNFIGYNASFLPSEKDGFTSKIENKLDNNNLPNMYYVSLTSEQFQKDLATIIYRTINPIFGEWNEFQYSNEKSRIDLFKKSIYEDYATNDFNNFNIFMFDWQGNNYNNSLVVEYDLKPSVFTPKFIGILKSGDMEFVNDKDIKVNFIVDYKIDDERVLFTKKIKLNIVNIDGKLLVKSGEIVNV